MTLNPRYEQEYKVITVPAIARHEDFLRLVSDYGKNGWIFVLHEHRNRADEQRPHLFRFVTTLLFRRPKGAMVAEKVSKPKPRRSSRRTGGRR